MPQIPPVTRVTKGAHVNPISTNDDYQTIADVKTQGVAPKTSQGRHTAIEKKGLDVAFAVSSKESLGKIEIPTATRQSIEIIQTAYLGLGTIGKVLGKLFEGATLVQNHGLSPSVKEAIFRLLDEVDYIAQNTKSHDAHVLSNSTGEIIILVNDSDGKEVNFRPFHISTEELGLRALASGIEEDGILEEFIFAIEKSIGNIGFYQADLMNIAKQLGLEGNIRITSSFQPDEAREMSDETRALILSAYGVTFFSQMTKQLRNFARTSAPFILLMIALILIILVIIVS